MIFRSPDFCAQQWTIQFENMIYATWLISTYVMDYSIAVTAIAIIVYT